ncbi:MAG: hypothetical protein PUB08_01490 [Firmicutes bacterium]|nr:hypothetical protein [Bacillota bacterium]
MITINVWTAKDANTVKLTDIDGDMFIGKVVDIIDEGEESEDYGYGEDSIALSIDGKEILFSESEIANIEIID